MIGTWLAPLATAEALPWIGAVTVFCSWFYALRPATLARWLGARTPLGLPASEAAVLLSKAAGAMLFGAVALALSPSLAWLRLPDAGPWMFTWLALAAVFVPIAARGSARPAVRAHYPEFRLARASSRWQAVSAATWLVYLTGYEWLFRGLVLHTAIAVAGPEAGIALHVALYVLAHLHKDAGETFGCILMGYLFAGMTLSTGSVWPAVVLHAAIAISAEQTAGRLHPELAWGKQA